MGQPLDSQRGQGERCVTDLNKHLVSRGRPVEFIGGTEDRHGLPVSGELQGELLPHQLLDHLVGSEAKAGEPDENDQKSRLCLAYLVNIYIYVFIRS